MNWHPSIPLAEVHRDCLQKAQKLMRALLPSLERRANWIGSIAEFWQAAAADYKRVHGKPISIRRLQELCDRTIDRAGQNKLSQVELYLDDRLKREIGGRALFLVASEADFAELHDKIARFENPAEPTSVEKAELWRRALEVLSAGIESGKHGTRVKAALLSFLWRHAPRLSKNQNALRVMLDYRLKTGVLRDKRELRKGVPIAPAFPQEDVDIMAWHTARNCGGRISQGVRECIDGRAKYKDGRPAYLTPLTIAICTQHNSGKSYVPRRLRDLLAPLVRRLMPLVIGGRAANDDRATGEMNYSASFSDDIYTSDDVTLPVETFMRGASGEIIRDADGKVILVRGQCLLFADVRSRMVLGFSLQPERNYNQWGIRTLTKNVFRRFAVPRFLLWEKNIWQRGKLLTGGPQWRQRTDDECQEGLGRFGVRFIFTSTPQGKGNIERIAGLLQDHMEGEPGYVGRNERIDKPQRTKDAERLVISGRADSSEHFYEFTEWLQRLEQIIDEYNNTKQEGMLDGLSPMEAYAKFQNHSNPPMRYEPAVEFLLSYDWKRVTVTKDGIRFEIGGQRFIYCGEAISHLAGQEVLAWFDPEDPSSLAVTDLSHRNPVVVERFIPQGPTAAYDRPDDYRRELAKVRGQDAWPKIRYRTLKAKFEPARRLDVPNLSTVILGQKIEGQRAAIQKRNTEAETRRARTQRKARQLNMPTAILGQHGDEDEGLRLMQEADRQHDAETKGQE